MADALRFRRTPDETKFKLLFKQGHSPSSAHFVYENKPQILVTSKISDTYNIEGNI